MTYEKNYEPIVAEGQLPPPMIPGTSLNACCPSKENEENTKSPINHNGNNSKSLHIAPMLHVSNTEFRNFFRILTKKAVLWTEMIVDETLHFNRDDPAKLEPHLAMTAQEPPVVCQIGGIDAKYIATATQLARDHGYCEINLNMDCPSSRVSGRKFGAILMKDVDTAVEILRAMSLSQHQLSQSEKQPQLPVSLKCRVGIDEWDSMEFLVEIITKLSTVCQRFILHARKCLLQGLSPRENRLVPPLNYPRIYEVCRRFPHCQFWINGGIPGLKACKDILYGSSVTTPPTKITMHHQVPCTICNAPNGSCTAPPAKGSVPSNLQGCMLGRAAMDHPVQFHDVDRYFYGCPTNPCQNRRQLLEEYCNYLEQTYPRRCCDSDERVTTRAPAPQVVHDRPSCSVCCCQSNNANDDGTTATTTTAHNASNKIKISTVVIDRSFKPILGVFFGLPGSRTFRHTLDVYSRNMTLRNCGPAFLLRKTMQVMPAELLDQDFVKTEDLKEGDIPVHVSPPASSNCGACT